MAPLTRVEAQAQQAPPAARKARAAPANRAAPAVAVAEPVANSGSKASHFQEGVDFMNAGRYEQAAAAFKSRGKVDNQVLRKAVRFRRWTGPA